jgi:hypothetical protein
LVIEFNVELFVLYFALNFSDLDLQNEEDLASYFSRVPNTQLNKDGASVPPPPQLHKQEKKQETKLIFGPSLDQKLGPFGSHARQ